MKKIVKIKIFFALLLLITAVGSSITVSSIPDEIILFKGEKLNLGPMFTIDAETDTTGVLRGGRMDYSDEGYFADVKLAGVVNVKTVKVSVVDAPTVIPCGNPIGVKLRIDGLMVVGLSEFPSEDGIMVSPGKTAGVKTGDIIKSVDNTPVSGAEEFTHNIEKAGGGAVTISVERNGAVHEYRLSPEKDGNGDLKLGIWVRNSVAGIGTMTFYNPASNTYGALGHGIADSDTGRIVPLGKGEIVEAEIVSVIKGEKGAPGELRGSFASSDIIGTVTENSKCGIYGEVESANIFTGNPVEFLPRSQITEGPAQILSCIEGADVQSYEIEIQKVSQRKNADTKCMVIKVTDADLLSKTGGILQGMSGSPILRDGKLLGAVTHVFVNDPTRGYAIFAENMLEEAIKVN